MHMASGWLRGVSGWWLTHHTREWDLVLHERVRERTWMSCQAVGAKVQCSCGLCETIDLTRGLLRQPQCFACDAALSGAKGDPKASRVGGRGQ